MRRRNAHHKISFIFLSRSIVSSCNENAPKMERFGITRRPYTPKDELLLSKYGLRNSEVFFDTKKIPLVIRVLYIIWRCIKCVQYYSILCCVFWEAKIYFSLLRAYKSLRFLSVSIFKMCGHPRPSPELHSDKETLWELVHSTFPLCAHCPQCTHVQLPHIEISRGIFLGGL